MAFNQSCAKAAPYAISLAKDFERQIYVLHVNPPHHAHLFQNDKMTNSEHEASALAHLNADADRNCAPILLIESSDPAEGILREAKRIHAVSIIMGVGRDSNPDLTTRLPWSITGQVNREATCPFLTVGG